MLVKVKFQHAAARRRLVWAWIRPFQVWQVSTRSRPKAAGLFAFFVDASKTSFNTQPPEGGWKNDKVNVRVECGFNTQPPEGGWGRDMR